MPDREQPQRARSDGSMRNIVALGIVSLLTDASSELVYPVLPLFLANVLGAPVAVIGVIESIAEATSSLMRPVSGWISDRVGKRRPLVLLGYGLSNVMKPLLAITASWPAVLLLRFADRLGKGVRTAPRDALIADSAPAGARGRAFGLHRALDTLGAAIGPLTAWVVLTLVPNGYRTIFLLSAIPGTLAIGVLLFAVREKVPHHVGPDASPDPPAPLRQALGLPFMVFTACAAVFALGNSSDALLILRAQDLGMRAALIPLAYFVFNIVGASLSTHIGDVSDRVGRRVVLTAGYALFGLVYAGFALARASWAPWLLFGLYGVPYAMTEGMARAFVVDLVGTTRRATAVGAFTFATGLAALPASAVAGLLWDSVSHPAPFWLGASLMLLAAAGLAMSARYLTLAEETAAA